MTQEHDEQVLTPENDEQIPSDTDDTRTLAQGGENDSFLEEIMQKTNSNYSNLDSFGGKAKVNLLHEAGDDPIAGHPDMEGGRPRCPAL